MSAAERGKEILPPPTHLLECGSIIYILKLDGTWWARCLLSGNPEVDPPLSVALGGVDGPHQVIQNQIRKFLLQLNRLKLYIHSMIGLHLVVQEQNYLHIQQVLKG